MMDIVKLLHECVGHTFSKDDSKQIENYIDELESKVQDLICDKENLQSELESLQRDLQDNYRPIPISEQVGISDRDFI